MGEYTRALERGRLGGSRRRRSAVQHKDGRANLYKRAPGSLLWEVTCSRSAQIEVGDYRRSADVTFRLLSGIQQLAVKVPNLLEYARSP
jgi:hypothetical protein